MFTILLSQKPAAFLVGVGQCGPLAQITCSVLKTLTVTPSAGPLLVLVAPAVALDVYGLRDLPRAQINLTWD